MTHLKRFAAWNLSLAILASSLLVGCGPSDATIALRQDLMLTVEPSEATSIADAKRYLVDSPKVSIVAQISSDETKAFVEGQAAFLINEVGHHECAAGPDCPFCDDCHSHEVKEAAVQFVDESGEPWDVDARDLLGVKPGDVVVIQGDGKILPELDMLQVSAKHIFVRPQQETN